MQCSLWRDVCVVFMYATLCSPGPRVTALCNFELEPYNTRTQICVLYLCSVHEIFCYRTPVLARYAI